MLYNYSRARTRASRCESESPCIVEKLVSSRRLNSQSTDDVVMKWKIN